MCVCVCVCVYCIYYILYIIICNYFKTKKVAVYNSNNL